MKNLRSEFYHDHNEQNQYPVRIGWGVASALSGFIAGALGAALYFYLVFSKLIGMYCSGR